MFILKNTYYNKKGNNYYYCYVTKYFILVRLETAILHEYTRSDKLTNAYNILIKYNIQIYSHKLFSLGPLLPLIYSLFCLKSQ